MMMFNSVVTHVGCAILMEIKNGSLMLLAPQQFLFIKMSATCQQLLVDVKHHNFTFILHYQTH